MVVAVHPTYARAVIGSKIAWSSRGAVAVAAAPETGITAGQAVGAAAASAAAAVRAMWAAGILTAKAVTAAPKKLEAEADVVAVKAQDMPLAATTAAWAKADAAVAVGPASPEVAVVAAAIMVEAAAEAAESTYPRAAS